MAAFGIGFPCGSSTRPVMIIRPGTAPGFVCSGFTPACGLSFYLERCLLTG